MALRHLENIDMTAIAYRTTDDHDGNAIHAAAKKFEPLSHSPPSLRGAHSNRIRPFLLLSTTKAPFLRQRSVGGMILKESMVFSPKMVYCGTDRCGPGGETDENQTRRRCSTSLVPPGDLPPMAHLRKRWLRLELFIISVPAVLLYSLHKAGCWIQ
jgi:hypothetical protein